MHGETERAQPRAALRCSRSAGAGVAALFCAAAKCRRLFDVPCACKCRPARAAPPSRKGTRQIQSSTACAGNIVLTNAAMPEPSSSPPATLHCCRLPYSPRRPSGAHSTMNAVEPPHSPPAEKPCSRRATTIRTGAATPIVS